MLPEEGHSLSVNLADPRVTAALSREQKSQLHVAHGPADTDHSGYYPYGQRQSHRVHLSDYRYGGHEYTRPVTWYGGDLVIGLVSHGFRERAGGWAVYIIVGIISYRNAIIIKWLGLGVALWDIL